MPESEGLPLDCIVLAAGLSSRMKSFKPLLPLGDSTVVERSVENALAACRRVILVTGHGAERVEALFHGKAGVKPVRNERYEAGMFSSIRRGAAEVRGPACFIQPGDLPFVPSPLFFSLYEAFLNFRRAEKGGEGARPVSFRPEGEGRRGHPLLVNQAFIDLILAAPDESSMRDLFEKAGPPRAVPCIHPGAYLDLDTPEDYERTRAEGLPGE